ncbi:MAG TPA: FAD-linked oxidase C-terminal domain-containing protein [Actinomycetota bacterium]|nr:FAD-linked oxidase C-terminal domain-containing protein [Actinomycetota bacterium]
MVDPRRPRADGSDVLDALARSLPSAALLTDRDVMESYRRDQAALPGAGMPLAVVRPRLAAEVQTTLRIASAGGVPVVPRGAGSGLSGGANAVDGGLVLSLTAMDRVLQIDRANLLAVVEPGVINGDLSAAAAERGLWYPPDPASAGFSSIGGNIATNAGGLCCAKYGVTRDSVLGLQVVLADGSLIRTGGRTVKRVAGYDLTGLFVGSEGTLGVVTEATLRLRPAPPPPATLVAFFGDLKSAGTAIAEITSEVVPSVLELMDRHTVRAVDEWKHMDLDLDAAAMLIGRSDAGGEQAANQIERMARACTSAGATLVARSSDPMEADLLMNARRLALPALERQGTILLDDVAVPIGRITELFEAIERIAADHAVVIGTFGHAGDGNMHPTLVYDHRDPEHVARARAAFQDILRAAVDLGGTITGEHGVGLLKRPWLTEELGDDGFRVHAAVKHALDPEGILNPGKVL